MSNPKSLKTSWFWLRSDFDRLTKFYQKEYEILPEAWIRLSKSYLNAGGCLSAVKSYPDLDRMSDSHLNEFLESSELQEWQKEELIQTTKKNDYYARQISWHELHNAKETLRECHIYLKTNGIFLKPEIKEKFSHIDDLIWKALVEEDGRLRYGGPRVDLPKALDELMKELETDVQRKLRE